MSEFVKDVETKFNKAKEEKELFYFDTTEYKNECALVNFEVTLAPALADKPGSGTHENKENEDSKKLNPFLNRNPALVVKELDNHVIMLNKFAVIPNHLLLVTKEFKKQSEPLSPDDIYEAFKIIQEFGFSQPALAFYNCGKNSGASQPHKHLQIVPLKREKNPQPPIKHLFDEIYDRKPGQIYAINKLPFVHVIIALDNNTLSRINNKEDLTDYLAQIFFGLLEAMFQQLRENTTPLETSFNFLLTQDFMMLVPRSKEIATVEYEGKKFEFSVNSLGFAGMLLAKTQDEANALVAQSNLLDMLTEVGVKWGSNTDKLERERQDALNAELA